MPKRGRPRKRDTSEVLSQIMQLFWEHGYEATGLSVIIAVTSMGKASLYSTFGNKHEMYLKALAHYEKLVVDSAVATLRAPLLAPLQRIEAFLSIPITSACDNADKRGCFLCNAAADRASLDKETDALVRRAYEKMYTAIVDALREIDLDKDPVIVAQQAQLVLTLYSGMRVMARTGMKKDELVSAKTAAMENLGHTMTQVHHEGSIRRA